MVLAMTLAAYALAMTIGRGHLGAVNALLLGAAAFGATCFVLVESRVASPLIRLATFRDPVLSASLVMSAMVSTVMMATLVVGPFYLSQTLGLGTALVGIALSAGPLVSALTGVPAGRIVDRVGAQRTTIAGLIGIASGASVVAIMPARFGVFGYLAPLVLMTASYAMFQAANNTVIMTGARSEQRGVISGLLSLSRNVGLVTGASVLGAVFAFASATTDITMARPDAVGVGMRTTFAIAAILIVGALGLAAARRTR